MSKKAHPFSLSHSVFAQFVKFRNTCMLKRFCVISKTYTQKTLHVTNVNKRVFTSTVNLANGSTK